MQSPLACILLFICLKPAHFGARTAETCLELCDATVPSRRIPPACKTFWIGGCSVSKPPSNSSEQPTSCFWTISRVHVNAKVQSIWDVLPSRPSRTIEHPWCVWSAPASWPRPPSPPVISAVHSDVCTDERDAQLMREHTPPLHNTTDFITRVKFAPSNALIWEAIRDAARGSTIGIETVPLLPPATLLPLMIES